MKKKEFRTLMKSINEMITNLIFDVIYFFIIYIQKRGLNENYLCIFILYFFIKLIISGNVS